MSEHLLKNFSTEVQPKASEEDEFFYHEMMTHPALFTHPHPQKIAIIGGVAGILQEVLKHPSVTEIVCITASDFAHLFEMNNDHRIKYYFAEPLQWLDQTAEKFDVIIQSELLGGFPQEHYRIYHQALAPDGILMQPCPSPYTQLTLLKMIYQNIKEVGFCDWQLMNFPQPSFSSGLRSALMATKRQLFKRLHEKDIYNRTFATRYYNFDMHKAALALPEFVYAANLDRD